MSAQARQQKIRLGNLLIRNRLISEAQLQAALEEQKKSGRKLGRVLIGMGAVTEEKILQLLSDQLKVPIPTRPQGSAATAGTACPAFPCPGAAAERH